MNLREKLTSGAIEVAIINEEQFVIKRKDRNLIEIIAIIPTLIDNLRVKLNDSSLDVCSIDGHQKIVKRDGLNMIAILSDIVPIDGMVEPQANTSNTLNQENSKNLAQNERAFMTSEHGWYV